ncbi:MAG: hypothetical protein ACD_78C00181G0002 [uncultured bacterium (gcode 4)]|uniref:Uncharacterized protein n=1 Tax=uncultured bacterium (gcode 4) TaxID=1234023 RepID=K1XXW7_9BACT|nr:MAG: hypothetical protein ACD_78C00181G0002 [uncultured bacterium (gcode 4)]
MFFQDTDCLHNGESRINHRRQETKKYNLLFEFNFLLRYEPLVKFIDTEYRNFSGSFRLFVLGIKYEKIRHIWWKLGVRDCYSSFAAAYTSVRDVSPFSAFMIPSCSSDIIPSVMATSLIVTPLAFSRIRVLILGVISMIS